MKYFYISFLIILIFLAIATKNILIVWNRSISVEEYKAQTDRLHFIDFGCMGIQEGRGRAFILDEVTIKCSDVIKNYVHTD